MKDTKDAKQSEKKKERGTKEPIDVKALKKKQAKKEAKEKIRWMKKRTQQRDNARAAATVDGAEDGPTAEEGEAQAIVLHCEAQSLISRFR